MLSPPGAELVDSRGGRASAGITLIELPELGGRAKLTALGVAVTALVAFDGF